MADKDVTQPDVGGWLKTAKILAADSVRGYARLRCARVPAETVEALCAALGEISVDEAMTALDREQAAQAGR